jgi:hypothetical protein
MVAAAPQAALALTLRTTQQVILAGAVLMSSGCMNEVSGDQSSGLSLIGPTNTDMQAATSGRLVDQGGCIGLARDDGRFIELVWPEDEVEWQPDDGEVVFHGEVLQIGDMVRLGGGFPATVDYTSRPAMCEGVEETWEVATASVTATNAG